MAHSSTKAEYRALVDNTSELLWLRWLLKNLGVSTSCATPLYCDNQNAIHIAHNDVFHEQTKHIEINCHFICYHLVYGALKLFSISSKDQLADIFTKSHPKGCLRALVDNLKLVSHPPWVWGGLFTCNGLWVLSPPCLLVYHTSLNYTLYLLYKGTHVYFIQCEIQYYSFSISNTLQLSLIPRFKLMRKGECS